MLHLFKKRWLILVLSEIAFTISGQEKDTSYVKLLFAGDVMGHDSQIIAAYNDSTKSYSYDNCFSFVAPFIQQADYAVANLEVTLAGPPYKGYPQFSSPKARASALKNAGFDLLLTANNHSVDRGKKGIETTVKTLDSLNIAHVGTYVDSVSRDTLYPYLTEINGVKFTFLNCTYGTNGIAVPPPAIVNLIDTVQIKADLEKAKSFNPDCIIMTIHWGIEYERNENKTQQNLARFILENGADAVIGSHPHVVQPVKKYYKNSDSLNFNIIAYSLGNYISNQRKRYTDGGIMFELNLQKVNGNTSIVSYNYLPVWVYKPAKADGSKDFAIVPGNAYLKGLKKNLTIDNESKTGMKTFYEDVTSHLKDIPENNYDFTK